LLGQREGRTGAAVIDWLRERTPQFRDAIEFVAIDPAAVYASAIRTPGLLPNAQIVVDHFHLVKLGNDALTKVRRRVTWELRDHRGRKLDPEWANRRRLLRARERLSQSSFARMWNTIIDEDPSAQDLSAWIAKTMRFMDVRLHFRHSAACTVASKTCCPPSIGGGYRPPPTCDAPGPAPPRSPGP
jgi:transposase